MLGLPGMAMQNNHITLISHKEAENMQMKAAVVKLIHHFLRSLGNGFPFPKGPTMVPMHS